MKRKEIPLAIDDGSLDPEVRHPNIVLGLILSHRGRDRVHLRIHPDDLALLIGKLWLELENLGEHYPGALDTLETLKERFSSS